MIPFDNTKLDVICVDAFMGFVKGSFSMHSHILVNGVDIAIGGIAFVINLQTFKYFTMGDVAFYESDRVLASFGESLFSCKVNLFVAKGFH